MNDNKIIPTEDTRLTTLFLSNEITVHSWNEDMKITFVMREGNIKLYSFCELKEVQSLVNFLSKILDNQKPVVNTSFDYPNKINL